MPDMDTTRVRRHRQSPSHAAFGKAFERDTNGAAGKTAARFAKINQQTQRPVFDRRSDDRMMRVEVRRLGDEVKGFSLFRVRDETFSAQSHLARVTKNRLTFFDF